MSLKLVVTNSAAIRAKYGDSGWDSVASALSTLHSYDASLSITDYLVDLSTSGIASNFSTETVTTKNAIDKAWLDYMCLVGDFITIIGGPDIVAHQRLYNPANNYCLDDGGDVYDPYVTSDLPYASDSPWSPNISSFLDVTRSVGRIPDVSAPPQSSSPNISALLNAINAAAAPLANPPRTYPPYFSICAQEFLSSCEMGLGLSFDDVSKIYTSPSHDSNWTASQALPQTHYFMCHGFNNPNLYPYWYGNTEPVYESETLPALPAGVVVSAANCYGANLYPVSNGDWPICNKYMNSGAAAFMGSTTAAYAKKSPVTVSNGLTNAVYMTGYFLKHVQSGMSCGAALLQVRQDFVKSCKSTYPFDLSPWNLKTIGQFLLMGDASRVVYLTS